MIGTRHLSLLTLIVGFALTATAQTNSEWRDSLAVLSRQIELNPSSVELRLRKANINLQLQQWEYAIEECNRVLAYDQRNAAALYYRAYANTNMRRYDLAKNDYNEMLLLSPSNLEARLGLAYTYIRLNRMTNALDEMNTLVEQHRDSAIAYAARAELERELRQYDAAVYDWKEAVRLSPSNADYVVSAADLLIGLGRKSEALAVLDEAVKKGIARGILKEWYERCR